MSKKIKLLLILIALTLGIPYIKTAMIYIGIFELFSANFIKTKLFDIFNLFSIPVPNIMLIMMAEIFWPFVLTLSIMKGCKYFKKNNLMHPAAIAAGFWIILNGSSILIS